MPKAYWIGHMDVKDPAVYENYKAANAAVFAEYGARFVVRAGDQVVVEGAEPARTVVLEFDSYEAAKACYYSDAYQAAKAIRDPVASGNMVIVEGYDG